MDALKKIAGLAYNYFYDLHRFWRYASNHRVGGCTETQRVSAIIATYHVIEKGMSMPEVRLGYGQDVIRKLIGLILSYQSAGYSINEQPIEEAVGALTCRTSIISAQRDKMTPPRNGKAIADAVQGAAYILLPEIGHFMLGEAPNASLGALKQAVR